VKQRGFGALPQTPPGGMIPPGPLKESAVGQTNAGAGESFPCWGSMRGQSPLIQPAWVSVKEHLPRMAFLRS
jgi:hypothetical protein